MCVLFSAISSFPHLPNTSSFSWIHCDESKRLWKPKKKSESYIPYFTWDFISIQHLFFSSRLWLCLTMCFISKEKPFTFLYPKGLKNEASPISSIQPPSSPCQQGVCAANSHTSSWAVAARPAAMLRIKQFLSKYMFSRTCIFLYSIRLCIMTSFPLIIDRFIWTLFMLIWKYNLARKDRMWQ